MYDLGGVSFHFEEIVAVFSLQGEDTSQLGGACTLMGSCFRCA